MNWSLVDFDWNQARAFLATVEEGSLSGAARALGLTQPTVGRQISAFEKDLGVVLFERIGRSLSPTPACLELVEHVRAMRDAAGRFSLSASAQSQAIAGKVSITATDVFSVYLLPPVLKRLRELAPELQIDIVASDEVRDLQLREADIAVRHVRPEQPELIARLLYEANGHFYASTEYLQRRGRPLSAQDLTAHDFISYGDTKRMVDYLQDAGLPIAARNFRIGSANGVVSWELAQRGFGIAPMMDQVAAMTDGVERLLPDMRPFTIPVWLTTHRELHSSRRIRLVYDALAHDLTP